MDSPHYLTLARQLVSGVQASTPLTGGNGAAECRCAISRAYYSAYNVAVDFLDLVGFKAENVGSCHTAVQYAFNQCGNAALATVSTNLATLYSERRKADYEMKNSRAESIVQADAVVTLAERAIALVDTVRSDSSFWGAIATGVLDYITTSKTTALSRKSGNK